MSLIFSGSAFGTFGRQLPTPIIEKISVYDSYLEAELGLYFVLNGTDNDNSQRLQIESDLSTLQVYGVTVYGANESANIINQTSDIFENFAVTAFGGSGSYLKYGAETGVYSPSLEWDISGSTLNRIAVQSGLDMNNDGLYEPAADLALAIQASEVTSSDWSNYVETANDGDTSANSGYPIPFSALYDESNNFVSTIHADGREWFDSVVTRVFDAMIEAEVNTGSLNYMTNKDNVVSNYNPNYTQEKFNPSDSSTNWILGDDKMYDTNGNAILKYGAAIQITPNFGSDNVDSFSLADDSVNIFNSTERGLNSYFQKSMTFFAFTSFIDYSNLEITTGLDSDQTPSGIGFIKSSSMTDYIHFPQTFFPDINPALLPIQTSDLAYQSIFIDGNIDTSPMVRYVYEGTNRPVSIPVIQSITGQYYDTSALSIQAISTAIQELARRYANTTAPTQQTAEAVTSMQAILSKYIFSPRLLMEMNIYRKSFPDKSIAIYEQIKTIVLQLNRTLKAGAKVTKELVTKNIIVDKREIPLTPLADSVYDEDTKVIYNENACVSSEVLMALSADGESLPAVTTAYVLFDQERALKYNSNLSQVLDVEIIESIFGKEITNLSFYVNSATVRKWEFISTRADGDYSDIVPEDFVHEVATMGYLNTMPDGPAEQLSAFGTGSIWFNNSSENSSTGAEHLASSEELSPDFPELVQYSYVVPRAWDIYANTVFTGSIRNLEEALEDESTGASNDVTLTRIYDSDNTLYNISGPPSDYRIQCFEIQDIKKTSTTETFPNDRFMYSIEVEVQDNSLQVVSTLTSSFQTAMQEFQEYVEYAEEHCSYNNIEGRFNDFFVAGISSAYSGSLPYQYPWNKGPALYYAHLDLLTSQFGHDVEAITIQAKETAALINPYNGLLENVQEFYTKMEDFYNLYYSESGQIPQRMIGLEDTSRLYPINNESDRAWYPSARPSISFDVMAEGVDPTWKTRWRKLLVDLSVALTAASLDYELGARQRRKIYVPDTQSGGQANLIVGEMDFYWWPFLRSTTEVYDWFESGLNYEYRQKPGHDSGTTEEAAVIPSADERVPNDSDLCYHLDAVMILLESLRKFNCFLPTDSNGNSWPRDVLVNMSIINKVLLTDYQEEFLEIWNEYATTYSLVSKDMETLAETVTEEGGYYNPFVPHASTEIYDYVVNDLGYRSNSNAVLNIGWTFLRAHEIYNIGYPLSSESGFSNRKDEILEMYEEYNENITDDWNSVNGWDGEDQWFGMWFLDWAGLGWMIPEFERDATEI
tara:strand:+ start:1612 stop:5430 length:3819 start_codon:yes stop_codon:yes gene_type:complete